MSWKHLLKPLFPSAPATVRRRPALAVTHLEDRTVPAGLVVNTLADAVAADNKLSLREAINAVNTGSNAGLDNGAAGQISQSEPFGTNDTIFFSVVGAIVLGGTHLTLAADVSIVGPGTNPLTVNGDDASRVFAVNAGVTAALSDLTVTGGRLTATTSPDGEGGGIYNAGALTLTGCTIIDNSATRGGGISCAADAELTLTGSSVSENFANTGGGLYNVGAAILTDSVVSGNVSAQPGGGIASVGELLLTNTAVDWNEARLGSGGGILSNGPIVITGGSVSNNTAAASGGILTTSGAVLTGVTIADNHATGGAGGITFGSGGGVLRNCTVSGNTAGAVGGGVFVVGAAEVVLVDTTVSGNTAGAEAALFGDGGDLVLVNCTVAGNTAAGAGGILWASGTLVLINSIVADNISTTGLADTDLDAAEGTLSGRNNIVEAGDTTGLVGTLVTDPMLGPLADNGGPTRTMALLDGSPAFNAGDNSLVTAPLFPGPSFTDQRGDGFARIQFGQVDIGAFEVQQPPVVVTFEATDTTADENGSGGTGRFTVTRTGDTTGPLTVTITIDASSTATDPDYNSATPRAPARSRSPATPSP